MSWSPRHFLTLPFDTINRCKFLASEKFLQIPNMEIWRSQVRNVWWIGKTLPCPMPCTVEVMWAAHILILLHSSTTTQVKRPGLQHETALLKCPTGDCSYHHTTWHEINENGFVNVPKVCCHHPSHDHSCFQLPLFSQHGILPYHCIHFWTVVAQTCLTTGDDMWQKVFNCSLMILEAGQTGGHSVTPLLVGQLFQHPSAALCKIKEFHRQYPIYCNVRGWISVLAALVIGMYVSTCTNSSLSLTKLCDGDDQSFLSLSMTTLLQSHGTISALVGWTSHVQHTRPQPVCAHSWAPCFVPTGIRQQHAHLPFSTHSVGLSF